MLEVSASERDIGIKSGFLHIFIVSDMQRSLVGISTERTAIRDSAGVI